jgi:hypothetical protein
MTATFEFSRHECLKDGQCLFGADESSWKRQNIRVIMYSTKSSHLRRPSERAPHVLMPISSHAHSVTTTADEDSKPDSSGFHGLRDSMRRVGIIHALGTIASEVRAIPPDFAQALLQMLLQLEARVVAAEGNGLFHVANIPAYSGSSDFSTPGLFTSPNRCSHLLISVLYQQVPWGRGAVIALPVQNAMLHQPLMNTDDVCSSPLVIHNQADQQNTRIVH